jgi:ABC-type transport system involved in multi-copper enzyme maturation permease subunit
MILPIASHTFREAIRKKILHVLIGLGIFIMAISPVIPTTDEPNARVKIIFVIFFQVVMLLCIVGVILLSATSLPYEIEDRTIYGILSKPISRLKIVIGKIGGFALLSGVLLTIFGLLNMIAVWWAASSLPEGQKSILKARNEFKASQFSIEGKLHHVHGGIAWIEGGRSGIASWNFSNLKKEYNNKTPLEVELNVKVESIRGNVNHIPLVIGIEDLSGDKKKTEILSGRADEPLIIRIDPEITKDGAIHVTVFPILEMDCIGVTQEGVKVFSIQEGFVFNYGKALIISFLKFLLIIVIAVMGSTYLSAPVSIVSALVIFSCGHILDFIKDFSLLIQHGDGHEHLPSVMKNPSVFLVYTNYLIKKPLEWLSFFLPDFKRFDSLKFLLKGINIPLEDIGAIFGYTALYAGACILISSVVFKRREFF